MGSTPTIYVQCRCLHPGKSTGVDTDRDRGGQSIGLAEPPKDADDFCGSEKQSSKVTGSCRCCSQDDWAEYATTKVPYAQVVTGQRHQCRIGGRGCGETVPNDTRPLPRGVFGIPVNPAHTSAATI